MKSDKNYEKNYQNNFKCRFCDKTFNLKESFMIHKKTDHMQAVPKCKKFMKGECIKHDKCWYNHDEINVVVEEENIQENLGFHKEQENSQPPDMMRRILDMMEKIIVKVDRLEKVSTPNQ